MVALVVKDSEFNRELVDIILEANGRDIVKVTSKDGLIRLEADELLIRREWVRDAFFIYSGHASESEVGFHWRGLLLRAEGVSEINDEQFILRTESAGEHRRDLRLPVELNREVEYYRQILGLSGNAFIVEAINFYLNELKKAQATGV